MVWIVYNCRKNLNFRKSKIVFVFLYYYPVCDKRAAKVISTSTEDHIEPFKTKITTFIEEGNFNKNYCLE